MSAHDETAVVEKPHKHPNYFAVFISLAALTAILTAIELSSQSGAIEWPRATLNSIYLSIAVAKAVLVAMFYMHLKSDSFLYTVLFGVPVIFAIVFFILILV